MPISDAEAEDKNLKLHRYTKMTSDNNYNETMENAITNPDSKSLVHQDGNDVTNEYSLIKTEETEQTRDEAPVIEDPVVTNDAVSTENQYDNEYSLLKEEEETEQTRDEAQVIPEPVVTNDAVSADNQEDSIIDNEYKRLITENVDSDSNVASDLIARGKSETLDLCTNLNEVADETKGEATAAVSPIPRDDWVPTDEYSPYKDAFPQERPSTANMDSSNHFDQDKDSHLKEKVTAVDNSEPPAPLCHDTVSNNDKADPNNEVDMDMADEYSKLLTHDTVSNNDKANPNNEVDMDMADEYSKLIEEEQPTTTELETAQTVSLVNPYFKSAEDTIPLISPEDSDIADENTRLKADTVEGNAAHSESHVDIILSDNREENDAEDEYSRLKEETEKKNEEQTHADDDVADAYSRLKEEVNEPPAAVDDDALPKTETIATADATLPSKVASMSKPPLPQKITLDSLQKYTPTNTNTNNGSSFSTRPVSSSSSSSQHNSARNLLRPISGTRLSSATAATLQDTATPPPRKPPVPRRPQSASTKCKTHTTFLTSVSQRDDPVHSTENNNNNNQKPKRMNHAVRYNVSLQCIKLTDECPHRRLFTECANFFCQIAFQGHELLQSMHKKSKSARELVSDMDVLLQERLQMRLEAEVRKLKRIQAQELVQLKEEQQAYSNTAGDTCGVQEVRQICVSAANCGCGGRNRFVALQKRHTTSRLSFSPLPNKQQQYQ